MLEVSYLKGEELRRILRQAVASKPNYTRGGNHEWKNLVIISTIFDELVDLFLENLRELRGAGVNESGITALATHYSTIRKSASKSFADTMPQLQAYQELEAMLGGFSILSRLDLLLWITDSQSEELLEAHSVAHPPLETIRRYLEAERALPYVPEEARAVLEILVTSQPVDQPDENLKDLPKQIGDFIESVTTDGMTR